MCLELILVDVAPETGPVVVRRRQPRPSDRTEDHAPVVVVAVGVADRCVEHQQFDEAVEDARGRCREDFFDNREAVHPGTKPVEGRVPTRQD